MTEIKILQRNLSADEINREVGYRKGYYDAVGDVIRAGIKYWQLVSYKDYLYAWCNGDCTVVIAPPEMPQPEIIKIQEEKPIHPGELYRSILFLEKEYIPKYGYIHNVLESFLYRIRLMKLKRLIKNYKDYWLEWHRISSDKKQAIYESHLIVPEKAQKLSEIICPYCHKNCIKPIPRDAPGYILDAFFDSDTLSTCRKAQRFQKKRTGYSYNDIIRLVALINSELPTE
jgi:hypothetical protein